MGKILPDIPDIVRTAKRIAVVGWSDDPYRPSHDVADYLHENGFTIIPVNPTHEGMDAYGTKVVKDLKGAAPVDVALIFRRSEQVPMHEQDALEANVPVFWMQSGIRNQDVALRLVDNGLVVVQDRCFKVEHAIAVRHA